MCRVQPNSKAESLINLHFHSIYFSSAPVKISVTTSTFPAQRATFNL